MDLLVEVVAEEHLVGERDREVITEAVDEREALWQVVGESFQERVALAEKERGMEAASVALALLLQEARTTPVSDMDLDPLPVRETEWVAEMEVVEEPLELTLGEELGEPEEETDPVPSAEGVEVWEVHSVAEAQREGVPEGEPERVGVEVVDLLLLFVVVAQRVEERVLLVLSVEVEEGEGVWQVEGQ